MSPNLNRRLHALLDEMEVPAEQKAQRVAFWSAGATSSSADLTDAQAQSLIAELDGQQRERLKALRSKAVKCLVVLGYGHPSGKGLDWGRAEHYIQSIGTRNPRKAKLWDLNCKELRAIDQQLQQRVSYEAKRQNEPA